MQKTIYLGGCHTATAFLARHTERIHRLICSREHSSRLQAIINIAKDKAVEVSWLPSQELEKLLPNIQHQGVIIECHPLPRYNLESWLIELDKKEHIPQVLVLDQVQDPQNLGACMRLAAVFDVDAVIIPARNAASMNATVAKVASGADAIVPLIEVVNITRALTTLKQAGFWIYGTAEQAEQEINQADVSVATAWVMGNEAKGMRQQVAKSCDQLFIIPTATQFTTLNVAMSAGICLYETMRKRKEKQAKTS